MSLWLPPSNNTRDQEVVSRHGRARLGGRQGRRKLLPNCMGSEWEMWGRSGQPQGGYRLVATPKTVSSTERRAQCFFVSHILPLSFFIFFLVYTCVRIHQQSKESLIISGRLGSDAGEVVGCPVERLATGLRRTALPFSVEQSIVVQGQSGFILQRHPTFQNISCNSII